jgi:hypothetical protein
LPSRTQGRDRSESRHRVEAKTRRLRPGTRIDVEQPLEHRALRGRKLALRVDEMDVLDVDSADLGVEALERREQSLDPEA